MLGKKLLVADDSLTIQKVIRLALSNEGYEIQTVSDGNDALQQISLFQPDVILIDVSLPGKTGFEVKREINGHEEFKDLRFILMSSAFEEVDEEQALEVTFHGRLTKPFDPAHLRQVLTDVLAQVAAKRMEATSILQLHKQGTSFPPPPISIDEPSSFASLPITPPPPPHSKDSQEWEQLMAPDELPPIPSPPSEPLNTLWEPEEDPTRSSILRPPGGLGGRATPPTVPPPFPENAAEIRPDTEIQDLTQSTIKIAESDEFQWNVNEPVIKPLPNMMDSGGSTFEMEPSLEKGYLDPPPPPFVTEQAFQHQGGSESVLNLVEPPPFTGNNPTIPTISQEQMELLIQNQIQSTLEKMAQKILPEVAERVIKQEIHRMLTE